MSRVLTVDDSRPIRMMVSKQLAELGHEVDEAEDGEQGLARLEDLAYDLIVLDVTMPVLDGPGMLARMRERGLKTPVLMLTSESKRSVVAEVMKLGIDDYILKPFKPEELKAKVQKILKTAAPQAEADLAAQAEAQVSAPRTEVPGRQFVDVLIVDDMENVHKKLRTLLPPHVTLNGCASAHAALAFCRERVFRVVLVDTDIPDVNSAALMNQLRMLQTHAVFLAMPLKSVPDAQKTAQQAGFDDVLAKPFDRDQVDEFLIRYFDDQELVVTEDNVLKVGAFAGKEERLDKYFTRVGKLLEGSMEKLAAACFDDAILDVTQVPMKPDRTPRLLLDVTKQASKFGIAVKLVANADGGQLLGTFDETAKLTVYPTVQEARAASAA